MEELRFSLYGNAHAPQRFSVETEFSGKNNLMFLTGVKETLKSNYERISEISKKMEE